MPFYNCSVLSDLGDPGDHIFIRDVNNSHHAPSLTIKMTKSVKQSKPSLSIQLASLDFFYD